MQGRLRYAMYGDEKSHTIVTLTNKRVSWDPNLSIFAMFTNYSGFEALIFCQNYFISFCEYKKELIHSQNRKDIAKLFYQFNQYLKSHVKNTSGCCATVAFIFYNEPEKCFDLIIANCGNIQCALFPDCKSLTQVHDASNFRECGRILLTEKSAILIGNQFNGKLPISRLFGCRDHRFVKVDPWVWIQKIPIQDEKRILIATKCIWNSLSIEDIYKHVKEIPGPTFATRYIHDQASNGGFLLMINLF